jgi:very-short-patch-repair endonuclease
MLFYNTKLKKYSQELRKNMTDAERLLWSKLRRKQVKNFQFYRQRIIGNYIVDFYCPSSKLIIEVDGG